MGSLWKVVKFVLILKFALFTIIFFGKDFIEFGYNNYFGGNFKDIEYSRTQVDNKEIQDSIPFMLSPFDGQWYTHIAREGYNKDALNTEPRDIVFYPLYPLLITLGSILLSSPEWAGVLISTISSFVFAMYLYLLIRKDDTEEVAWNSILFMFIYPTTVVLSAVYTESLFLALAIGAFYYGRSNKFFLACLLAMFACIVKVQGVILFPALLVEYYMLNKGKSSWREHLSLSSFLLIPIGIVAYFTYLYSITGHFFAAFTAQQSFGSGRPIGFHPEHLWEQITHLSTWHSFHNSPFDFLMVLVALALLIYSYKKIRLSYFIYSLGMVLLPLSTWTLMSFSRYLLVAFPLFIALSKLIANRPNLKTYVVVFSASFMGIFTMMFINWRWIG